MEKSEVKFFEIKINNPNNYNLILGQAHFIKTVEDLHEALVSSVPGIKFGLSFAEASGPRLIRKSGTDDNLIKLSVENIKNIACGHTFLIFLENAFPINVLNSIKNCPEVARIFAATANPLTVIVAQNSQGRGVMGVIDGSSPLGIENVNETIERKNFLRKIGYKNQI